jgi:predicted DNA-binding protein (UPF0278 family)
MKTIQEIARESIGADALAGIGYERDIPVAQRAIQTYRNELRDELRQGIVVVQRDIERSRNADTFDAVIEARDAADDLLDQIWLVLS